MTSAPVSRGNEVPADFAEAVLAGDLRAAGKLMRDLDDRVPEARAQLAGPDPFKATR